MSVSLTQSLTTWRQPLNIVAMEIPPCYWLRPFERGDEEGALCYVAGEEGGERDKLCKELGFVRVNDCYIKLSSGAEEKIYTGVAMAREPKEMPAQ